MFHSSVCKSYGLELIISNIVKSYASVIAVFLTEGLPLFFLFKTKKTKQTYKKDVASPWVHTARYSFTFIPKSPLLASVEIIIFPSCLISSCLLNELFICSLINIFLII